MADFDIVARASGQKPGDQRWTVLTITHQEGSFVAEIVGETLVEGEQRRVRVEEFNSVLAALAWGAFNQKSALYDELRRKATDWLEKRTFGDVQGRIPTMKPRQKPAVDDTPWDGGERERFREALMWLYAPLTSDVNEAVKLWVEDWFIDPDVGHNTVVREPEVFEVLEREEELGLPPWAETFVRAMKHFKRESFHAAR